MKIVGIFAHIEQSLYAVQFDYQNGDALTQLFEIWNDTVYLRDFFKQNEADLRSKFYLKTIGEISTNKAAEITIEEAERLEEELLSIANAGRTENDKMLQTIFKPLNNAEYRQTNLQKSKLYGDNKYSWLRIYAIRIAPNLFIITGGAIKLNHFMDDKPHLKEELRKLEIVKQYLIDEGLLDENDFEFLEI